MTVSGLVRAILIISAAALIAAAPAKWHPFACGMSKNAVGSRTPGLKPGDPAVLEMWGDAEGMIKTRDTLSGKIVLLGQPFAAHFGFEKDRLRGVMLWSDQATTCAFALIALKDYYGDPSIPAPVSDMTGLEWNSSNDDDHVSFWTSRGRTGCSINLMPLSR